MQYHSTKDSSKKTTLSHAILQGLAPDGGLFVPTSIPCLSDTVFDARMPLDEVACRLLTPFFENDELSQALARICKQSFSFPIPLVKLDNQLSLLELFHGPTAAFKDVGARFLSHALSFLTKNETKKRTILVATSGDTGSAVASAFYEHPLFQVVLLFPSQKVSLRQKKLLSCFGKNVHSIEVNGDFDDCQRMVKNAFLNQELTSTCALSSANSINIGRLLPQCVYYAKASLEYVNQTGRQPGLIIPSGNLGNAFAAMLARQMNFPIREVVLATNKNKVLFDFFESGQYQPRPSVSSLANAMDVGTPSNMERLLHYYPKASKLNSFVKVFSANDHEIKHQIKNVYHHYQQIICPHTATAFYAKERLPNQDWIIAATAHPAKFSDIVEPLLSKEVPIPKPIKGLLEKPTQVTLMNAKDSKLFHYINTYCDT